MKSDTADQVHQFYMSLAIEKAASCSPYIGIGCVATTSENELLTAGASKAGMGPHVLAGLGGALPDRTANLYLTQEPFLLDVVTAQSLRAVFDECSIDKLFIAAAAPGEYARQWCKSVEALGTSVVTGLGVKKLGLLQHVLATPVIARRPWITCVLLLDEQGANAKLDSLVGNFGFTADILFRINSHSLVVLAQKDSAWSKFYQATSGSYLYRGIKPKVIKLPMPLHTSEGLAALLDAQARHAAIAMIMPVTQRAFHEICKQQYVDELIVYKLGVMTDESKVLDLGLRLDPARWFLEDCSPIGDSVRYIFRTVRVNNHQDFH